MTAPRMPPDIPPIPPSPLPRPEPLPLPTPPAPFPVPIPLPEPGPFDLKPMTPFGSPITGRSCGMRIDGSASTAWSIVKTGFGFSCRAVGGTNGWSDGFGGCPLLGGSTSFVPPLPPLLAVVVTSYFTRSLGRTRLTCLGSQDGVGTTPPLISNTRITAICTNPEISVERLGEAYMPPARCNSCARGPAEGFHGLTF